MFFEVDIFVAIRARSGSQKLITLLSKTTPTRHPLEKYIPFSCIISALAIREQVPSLPYNCYKRRMRQHIGICQLLHYGAASGEKPSLPT